MYAKNNEGEEFLSWNNNWKMAEKEERAAKDKLRIEKELKSYYIKQFLTFNVLVEDLSCTFFASY